MGRIKHEHKNEDIGFQIAPMIDVVFVIMLFFMVKVGARQTETEIKSKLPGSAETSTSVSGMESLEETIVIDENGVIAHNDEILEAGGKPNGDTDWNVYEYNFEKRKFTIAGEIKLRPLKPAGITC